MIPRRAARFFISDPMCNRLLALLLTLVFSGCDAPPPSKTEPPGKLSIAVAASMRFAFEELAAAFTSSRPGITLEPIYGASGVFYAQITQKAPFDLFLSADTTYPDRLHEEGEAGVVFPYATGRLVLWAPKAAGLAVSQRGMETLKDPRVTRLSLANPALAPHGVAAEATLAHYGMADAMLGKKVLAENVGQAAQFVQSGAAQIGLFAYSLTFLPEMKDGDLWLVPATAHAPLVQSGTILPGCRDPELASTFRDFLLGPDGRAILERHGFSAP